MRRIVIWSPAARTDLIGIVDHIALDDPRAAHRMADRLDQAGAGLGSIPSGRPARVTGTYEKSVLGVPYIIAYEIVRSPNDDEVIAILRVIHQARDWPADRWPEP